MVSLALVGAGSWGKNYLSTAKRLEGVEIKCILTSSTNIAEIPPGIDGIIIASPAASHYPLAKHFLEQGQNVLIEKPFALSVAEAHVLQETALKSGSKVLVGHLHLYNPAYRAAKALIASVGALKKISFKGLVSPPRKDVSVLWDWGPHPASLFLDLVDAPVASVSATGNTERVTFTLTYENGVVAEAEIAWKGDKKERVLAIEGVAGAITFDDAKQDKKVAVELLGQSPTFPSYDDTPPLTIELEEFVGAIRDNREIYSGIEMGVQVTELLARVETELARNT